jgi:hypothetical protein
MAELPKDESLVSSVFLFIGPRYGNLKAEKGGKTKKVAEIRGESDYEALKI